MLRIGVALSLATASLLAAGPFELPAPTGSSPIGTTAWRVTSGLRHVGVHAWYPAARRGGATAAYLRDGLADVRAFATAIRGPLELFEALGDVQTHAVLDAAPAAAPATLPLLVFSHGYTAVPEAYTALLEDLASHGFIVLSVVHPYETGETDRVFAEWNAEDETMAAVTRTSDEAEQLRLTRGYLSAIPQSTAVVGRWVSDIRAVLDGVLSLAPTTVQGQLAARIDRSRIGVFGHSMGGVTSAQFCLEDRRCRAGLNLDGIPQYGSVVDGQLHGPFLMVYSARPGRLGASDVVYRRAASPYYRVDVGDTRHLDFSDMAFWPTLRERKMLGALPAGRITSLTRAIVLDYFTQELNGRPSALLAGTRREPEITVAQFRRKPL
jgi:Platelet-activating factor acetylhydrolase, isoform II